jgi:MFS family permease
VAPVAGRLSDRIGGKFILITGLAMFGSGMAWIALTAQTTSAWYDFLAPLLVAGFGMGCTFAPMTTVAMHDVEPRLAGAASGMLNTTRQVGAVIGTAGVGALLQNRLTASLTSQAQLRSGALPPPVRQQFITGFAQASKNGAGVSTGDAAGFKPPPGLPAQLEHQLEAIASAVFRHGFVAAMRPTMLLPIGVLAIGAASCLAIRRIPKQAEPAAPQSEPTATRA